MATLVRGGDIERWQAEGFLALDRPIIDAAAVAALGARLDPLVARWPDLPAGHAQDLGSSPPHESVREIVFATRLDGRLLRTAAYRAMRDTAVALLGRPVRLHFDHVVAKPPGAPETSWHQDVAFDPDHDVPGATVWMPLVDVGPDNGAMQYVPGSHGEGIVEHVAHGRHGLRAVDVPLGRACTVPLPAGGCAVHTVRTLHASWPNRSAGMRVAWVLIFVVDERPRLRRAVSAWRQRRRPIPRRGAA